MSMYDYHKYLYVLINHIIVVVNLYVINAGLKIPIPEYRWFLSALSMIAYILWMYFTLKKNNEMKKKMTKINIILGLFIVAFFCVFNVTIFSRLIKENGMESVLSTYGGLGKAMYFIICFLQPIVLPLPEPVTITTGNVVFGKSTGFILGFLGTVLGIATMFIISRTANKILKLNIINSKNLESYNKLVRKNETLILILLFIFPILTDEIICIGAGLSLIEFRKFLSIAIFSKFFTIGLYSVSSGIVEEILKLNLIYQLFIILTIIVIVIVFKKIIHRIKR